MVNNSAQLQLEDQLLPDLGYTDLAMATHTLVIARPEDDCKVFDVVIPLKKCQNILEYATGTCLLYLLYDKFPAWTCAPLLHDSDLTHGLFKMDLGHETWYHRL